MKDIALKHEGWVVVADGEKALFLYNEGDALYPTLRVFREMENENPPSREQGTDRAGRLSDVPGSHRSAVETTDWHRIEKERFAREISDRLYKFAHQNRFSALVLVAPPHVLGDLRKELHQEVASRIIAEVPKDLTKHPVDQIEALVLQ